MVGRVGHRNVVSSADVTVVGGGVAGLCVAERLATAGARVVVIEAETLGAGASGRGAGQLLLGVVEAPHRVVASLGEARTQELFALTRDSMDWLGSRGLLVREGQSSVALDEREPKELELTARVLEAMGFAAEVHPAEVAASRFGLAGPMLTTALGGRVRPAEALARLADLVRAAGAEVVERAPVGRIEESAAGLVIHAGERRVTSEIVVWAAGAGTRGLEPGLAEHLVPVREQALAVGGLPDAPPSGTRAGFGYTWLERDGTEGWVGGCRWATPHLEVGETEPVVGPAVQGRLDGVVERLGWTRPLRRWAWIEAHSRDGLPLVGPVPGSFRLVACTAFCGNDWGLAPGAAGLVAEGLLGESTAVSSLFSPTRFTA